MIASDLSADDAYAMTTSAAFQELKCRDAGALSWDVHVEDGPSGAVVRTRRKLPTSGFPSLLRKLVPSGVTSTETVRWDGPRPDGSRTGRLSVDFHGAPAAMKGTITIRPETASTSTVHVEAEFKALVPLIGGKVESIAAPIILGVIEAEERTGDAWAAGRRG